MEKVLQFGEGNFLRAFADWMIDELNDRGLYDGKVVLIQPIANGLADLINAQNGKYTLIARGIENGAVVEHTKTINCVSRCINPYSDYEAYMECALNPDLRVIISNTTEAGIAYSKTDKLTDKPQASFPGKLTAFLYKRFLAFDGALDKGFILLPCELIEANGTTLKSIVLKLADNWGLGDAFTAWINDANYFTNTLVDRIVTGYPRDEADELEEKIGWKDQLINTCEIFHFWVIEGDKKLAEELKFKEAGLNVVWTNDQTPYRTRKVRILNGAHTMTALAAYLSGKDTVLECIEDEGINSFIRHGLFDEIIPTLDLPKDELEFFANAVLERFANPFIWHALLSIALNSVSKFKSRVLPSILEYKARAGVLPERLTFSLAALIAFYRGVRGSRGRDTFEVKDNADILELFHALWQDCDMSRESIDTITKTVLAKESWWGLDLNNVEGLFDKVSTYLFEICTNGIHSVMGKLK